ncbi:hypothetical protein CYLTODRAFT_460466 [Cylindrobasidium torrendii FP15055 ss-10]|uniref:Uncharacterized protein n=1 Tax=Cylindrobasidium torrendii FP15055 ss-10 TaxID=1314674 RepID=A0A0D7ASF0_9AGAR|nr:hypothetical protein CYLTODRAFT_460466 [Cylindrobasidium torrendii FP15055 ss-10]
MNRNQARQNGPDVDQQRPTPATSDSLWLYTTSSCAGFLPSASGNPSFTSVGSVPSREGHLDPFPVVQSGPGMIANATTQTISFGSAPPWISGNVTTPGASTTGEYNAPIPGVSRTQTGLLPSSPELLQSPQPFYASPSI